MPAAPKSPTTQARRAGAPKAKGAVRAKSGCYTCRIRRKVCPSALLSIFDRLFVIVRRLTRFRRNAMSSPTQRAAAKLVFVFVFNVLALVQSAPNG